MPPIEEVSPQAEVARREEAVIVAESQIETAEDNLRTLILKIDDPDFWRIRLDPIEAIEFRTTSVDVDGAIRNALDQRTDLSQAKKQLELDDISIRNLKDQTRPELTADVDYGLAGLGGTQYTRSGTDLIAERIPVGERGFGSVMGDLFTNSYPTWTTQLRLTVPVGRSPQEASLARARLEHRQAEVQLKNQQMQIAAQVRQAARQVTTNLKRVDTTRSARELSERMLDAEQRKLTAGTSENYLVLQAQRDLAAAQNDELRAILDYQQSVVDLETVQEVTASIAFSRGLGIRTRAVGRVSRMIAQTRHARPRFPLRGPVRKADVHPCRDSVIPRSAAEKTRLRPMSRGPTFIFPALLGGHGRIECLRPRFYLTMLASARGITPLDTGERRQRLVDPASLESESRVPDPGSRVVTSPRAQPHGHHHHAERSGAHRGRHSQRLMGR